MTQEETQLLSIDLCARLPYKVKGIITYDKSNTTFTVEGIDNDILHLSDAEECHVEDFKPYLRPMSSVTEEEENEYRAINCYEGLFPCNEDALDYVLEHHLDFRGLIEKGLASEAPEGMYN